MIRKTLIGMKKTLDEAKVKAFENAGVSPDGYCSDYEGESDAIIFK